MKYNEWSIKIRTLVIFSHLKDNPVICSKIMNSPVYVCINLV